MNQFIEKRNCLECDRSSDCFTQKIDFVDKFAEQQKVQISYRKGETIIKEGTYVSSVFYVLDGIVKVYLESPSKNVIVKLLKSNDFLGLTSLYGDHTYHYSAAALTNTIICSIEVEAIRNLLSESNIFTHEIVSWYCKNYNLMFTKCFDQGLKQLHGKLASTLLYLDGEEFKSEDIYACLSRKDIAELSGMAVESVVRILTEFSDDKIIEPTGKGFNILNMGLLQKISRSG